MNQNEEYKRIVRQFTECLNTGDLGLCDDVLSEDFVFHNYRGTFNGREAFGNLVKTVREGFPDIRFEILDQAVDGNKVVNRITVSGTHEGEFNSVPPTNKQVSWSGMGFFYLEDGKITESWSEFDTLGMFTQLGVVDPRYQGEIE
jgi:steroid delta-isomerase-like uncharacterized protein